VVEAHGEWIVRARNPRLPAEQASLVAAAMLAVTSAMRGDRVVARAAGPDAARREMRRILRAYLQSYEDG
jgi:hypothetical protein